jgi:hypothetical protein
MADVEINRDFLDLSREFNAHEVRYLVVGGIAYSTYAEPRYTRTWTCGSTRRRRTLSAHGTRSQRSEPR